MIQRSNAWSRLLERTFPDSVRLSIHPQFRVSAKIGVRLVDSADAWLTPGTRPRSSTNTASC